MLINTFIYHAFWLHVLDGSVPFSKKTQTITLIEGILGHRWTRFSGFWLNNGYDENPLVESYSVSHLIPVIDLLELLALD